MHCDGFVNWPSNVTDYNIANTPWGKKGRGTYSELAKAFRAEGLKVGACELQHIEARITMIVATCELRFFRYYIIVVGVQMTH